MDKNTTHIITNDEIKGTTVSELSNIKYTLITIPSKGSIRNQGVDLSVGDEFDQSQIRRGFITYKNSQTSSFSDEFKVDLTSAMKGWLSNQTIHIKELTLTLEDNSLQGFRLWPNPTNNVFKIQFTNSDTNNVNIGLYDLQGRQILNTFKESKANIFTEEINIQNIASGIYLLTIQQGNKRITKKVMVSR